MKLAPTNVGGTPPRLTIRLSFVAIVPRSSSPQRAVLSGTPESASSMPRFRVLPMFRNSTPGKPRDGFSGAEIIASLMFLL